MSTPRSALDRQVNANKRTTTLKAAAMANACELHKEPKKKKKQAIQASPEMGLLRQLEKKIKVQKATPKAACLHKHQQWLCCRTETKASEQIH